MTQIKAFNNGDKVIETTKAHKGRQQESSPEQKKVRIAFKWDDGFEGAYSLKAIDRDGCVSNKWMRL